MAGSPAQDLNLERYFARIGYEGDAQPSLGTLQALHLAHAQTIPFENLNPLIGAPVRLETAALMQKLVEEERGGYCFEHNLLFADVLEALGYKVTRLSARVVWQRPEETPAGPRTHALLKIDLEGGPYLADVGFGGMTQTAPLRFAPGTVQATPHEPFRMSDLGGGLYQMEALVAGTWARLYRFDLQPQERIDYEVANHFVATHPASFFTTSLMGARPFPGGRFSLFNNQLMMHRLDASSAKVALANLSELREVLEQRLLIRLPASKKLDPALTRLLEQNAPNA